MAKEENLKRCIASKSSGLNIKISIKRCKTILPAFFISLNLKQVFGKIAWFLPIYPSSLPYNSLFSKVEMSFLNIFELGSKIEELKGEKGFSSRLLFMVSAIEPIPQRIPQAGIFALKQ